MRHPFSVKMQWHTGYRKGTWGVALKGLNANSDLLREDLTSGNYVDFKSANRANSAE